MYLAVGGWTYSCNYDLYKDNSDNSLCGDSITNYDIFPDVRAQIPSIEEGPSKG